MAKAPQQQTQYTYETVHGDSLPLIAELCGHSGEWSAIMDSSPFLWDLDWNNIQAGMSILLPAGWEMGTPDTSSVTNTGSSSVTEYESSV